MQVFNIEVPHKALTNIKLSTYAQELKIPHLRGVIMRDTLPRHPSSRECVIIKSNTSNQPGSNWVFYYRNKRDRIYFDSYGQFPPLEIQRYQKTGSEFDHVSEVMEGNTSREYISVWSTSSIRTAITSER